VVWPGFLGAWLPCCWLLLTLEKNRKENIVLKNEKISAEGMSFWFLVLFPFSMEIVHVFQKKKKKKSKSNFGDES